MAKLLNADYWKNAYLLEFKMNGVLTDAFTFSVPPESEEFIFPQRKNETKTFGGAVVADYGNDMVQINLSGSTINQELKLIYKSRLGSDTMTGMQEAFYLRDLLKKYGSRENLQNKEIYLYSLNGGGTSVRNNPKWWKIYVGELSISRNKDKPFCYNYKFSATGAPEIVRKTANKTSLFKGFGSTIASWYENIKELTDIMNSRIDMIEELGGGFLAELSEYISTARSCIDTFTSACTKYVNITNGFIKETTDIVIDAVSLGDKVLYSAIRYGPIAAAETWNTCLDTVAAMKAVGNYCANLGEEYFSTSVWQSIRELFDDSVSDMDIADTFATLGHDGIKAANKAQTITVKNVNTMGIAIIPGNTGEDDSIVITYGYKNIVISDAETTWDQLAQNYYGDSSLGAIIATYNNLPSDKPLKTGQSILIPKLNFAESTVSDNEVYNAHDDKDNYGKDILIEDNDFFVNGGDLAVATGIKNLEQALLNRYSTLIGARIRVEAYGIQASIGDALNATSSLIQASVHQTTIEDPRVENVEDINFVGVGDKLTVSVIYIDINGARRTFGGTV